MANPGSAESTRLSRLFHSPSLWLVIGCLLLLGPFLGKAVHVDDPLFVWAAQQICRHPLDFYGFSVNWYGVRASKCAHSASDTSSPACSVPPMGTQR